MKVSAFTLTPLPPVLVTFAVKETVMFLVVSFLQINPFTPLSRVPLAPSR